MASVSNTRQPQQPDYSTWSTSSLIARISELEQQLQNRTSQYTAEPAQAIPIDSAQNPSQKKRALSPSEDDFTHTPAPNRSLKKKAKEFDPSKYHTRFIALKFAYLGQRYNGFEHANGNLTPLPTIEEELWKALRRTRLILPAMNGHTSDDFDFVGEGVRPTRPFSLNWEGCQYSKGGRTDRGVSAFGQVIGIRMRSARPKRQDCDQSISKDGQTRKIESGGCSPGDSAGEGGASHDEDADGWDDVQNELPYVHLLNRVLPPDIRILAWCPHPPGGFDARFSCRERRYKYFFTNPAFSPTPGSIGFSRASIQGSASRFREGWLDINAMRQAAKLFEGVHDFRNFCKLDTSKQIENFKRIIYHADIELVDPGINSLAYTRTQAFRSSEYPPGVDSLDNNMQTAPTMASTPQVYAFTLRGSAFLWHQVRHMVSILFLIGQGLESPSIIPKLLDISNNPCKPTYEMASEAPLVLWDCIYPDETTGTGEDALDWIYVGSPSIFNDSGKGNGKYGVCGIVDDLWRVWRRRKIDEVLASSLLNLVVSQGDPRAAMNFIPSGKLDCGQKVFYGGNEARTGGKYIPVMQKRMMESVEAQNAKWIANKGRKQMAEQKTTTQ